jgi:hypothetical protein
MKLVDSLNDFQKDHLISRNLGNLLNLPAHLMIPPSMLEWLARHMSKTPGGDGVFRHKNKSIILNKAIVDKVFGFPASGTIPFALGSNDPEIVRQVGELRQRYLKGKNIPVKHLEGILLGTHDEVEFVRTFILYFITTVLCPATYNFVSSKYLFSLLDSDIPNVKNVDLGSLCLTHLLNEIDSWLCKNPKKSGDSSKTSYIGGCLPLLGVCALLYYFPA